MFLDTSGLMCLFDRKDRRHTSAIEYYASAKIRITHNYVLAEFVALAVARRAPCTSVLEFIKAIASAVDIQVVWVDQDLHDRALSFLLGRSDKAWSLCDAVSFVVMSERGVGESMTTDHDFEQAGFIRLLDR